MRILVTGASGFIGGYIVERLARQVSNTIIATGRTPTKRFDQFANVSYETADLTLDLQKQQCDICIHCAGLADDRASATQLELQNVTATKRLLESLSGCGLFIYISSSSVYDFSDGTVKNETDATPVADISDYGSSKLRGESTVIESGLPVIYILRPRAVYGPGDRVLLPRILKAIRKKFTVILGSLDVLSSMTHVENLYEVIEKVMLRNSQGIHIYNIADLQPYHLREVFAAISLKKSGHQRFLHIPVPLVKRLIRFAGILGIESAVSQQSLDYLSQNSVLSIEKIRREIGYVGQINFKDSMPNLDL